MKKFANILFIALSIVLLSAVYSVIREQVFAQYPSSPQEPLQVPLVKDIPWHVVASHASKSDTLFITVVVPEQKRILVYEQDHEGGLTLRGVRPIQFDLQMGGHNLKDPTPESIQEFLNRRPQKVQQVQPH